MITFGTISIQEAHMKSPTPMLKPTSTTLNEPVQKRPRYWPVLMALAALLFIIAILSFAN